MLEVVHILGIALLLGDLTLLELRVFGWGTSLLEPALARLSLTLVLELPEKLTLPADLVQRALPAQTAGVDGPALLAKAVLPTRRDRRWEIELAPLFRLGQWQMPEIKTGATLSMVGFTFKDEQGAAVLRAEYVFLDGKAYGLRSGPA